MISFREISLLVVCVVVRGSTSSIALAHIQSNSVCLATSTVSQGLGGSPGPERGGECTVATCV